MTKEQALTLALEALEISARNWPSDSVIEAITAIKEALAQPEPWAERADELLSVFAENDAPEVSGCRNSRSAQRPWVGLTDEELRQVWYDDEPVKGGTYIDKLRQVEAKLKQKNT